MALIGLDVGTTELKAAAFGDDGECLAIASVEYSAESPAPGYFELPAETLWAAARQAIGEVASGCGDPVGALAVCSHGESFVPVDKDGEPLHPFILNLDGRAANEMAALENHFGRQWLYETTGLPPHPMYMLPKITWLRQWSLETYRRATRFLCVQDYLAWRMTGEAATDLSLASRTLALDINSARWSPELTRFAGISNEHLPSLVSAGTKLGKLRRGLAGELGLSEGVVCVAGGHDQACTALGGGSAETGSMVDGTGTFEAVSVVLERPLRSPDALAANLPCERHVLPDRYLALAYVPGGAVLRWLRDNCAPDLVEAAHWRDKNAYDLLLSSLPADPTGLFVFPYWFGTGTPWMRSDVGGSVQGLTVATSRSELVKSALEGICFEMRWNLDILESLGIWTDSIRAVGGGARSGVWLQLKADVWGREIVALPGEAGCKGAALCAGIGAGAYSSWEEAVFATRRPGTVYEPSMRAHATYSERFAQYKELAEKLYGFSFEYASTHERREVTRTC